MLYSFDKGDGKGSLNEHTPHERCKVRYRDIDYAVRGYLKLAGSEGCEKQSWHCKYGQCDHVAGKRMIIAGKTDVQIAFRLLPLLKRCWKWLIMKAQDPKMGE